MAVKVGEIVEHGRVFGVQGQRLFPLLLRALLVLYVIQEAAKGYPRAGMVGMARDEVLIGCADGGEAVTDAPPHVGGGHASALGDSGDRKSTRLNSSHLGISYA